MNNRDDDFDNSFQELIINEGGYSNDPMDSGGKTIYGITKRDYPATFQKVYDLYKIGFKTEALEVAKQFYKNEFWNDLYFEIPDSSLSYKIFDLSVNRGKETAVKLLQRTLYYDFGKAIKIDGKFGQITLGAIKSVTPETLYNQYIKINDASYRSLAKFWYYGKGWLRRLVKRVYV